MSLTRTKGVLKHVLFWHTCALGNLYLIFILLPFVEDSVSLVLTKYFVGIMPSCMQLRSTPESIGATTSNSNSLLMTILTLECHFWKLILLMVLKNASDASRLAGSSSLPGRS